MVTVPMPQAVDVLGLVAADLAIDDARFGALGTVGCAWRQAPALVEAVGLHEAAQGRVGRHRLQAGLGLSQSDKVVVVKLDAPTLVRGVLGEHGLADGVADRVLLSCVDAHLAAQHADGIGSLSQRAIVPALDGREAKAHGLGRRRMLPRAPGQLDDRGPKLALGRRRGQQLADDGEAQMRPPFVNS